MDANIERLATKLDKFEESAADKFKQLEVRVAALEKNLRLGTEIMDWRTYSDHIYVSDNDEWQIEHL